MYCAEEPLAKQGVGTAKEVCGNHCVLGVHLPDEGHSIGDLVRASKGPSKGGPDQESFVWDAVDDGVAPLLELLGCSAGSVYVARRRDVNGWSACVPVTSVADEASGDEVRWKWRGGECCVGWVSGRWFVMNGSGGCSVVMLSGVIGRVGGRGGRVTGGLHSVWVVWR